MHGCVWKAAVVVLGWCGHFDGSDTEKLSLKSLHMTSNDHQSKRICNCCKRHLRKLKEMGVHHLWFQASASGWILWLPR